jgi:hypothetical protein
VLLLPLGPTSLHHLSRFKLRLRYAIERERVATMLAPLDDPLPNCHLLASRDEFAEPITLGNRRGERIDEVTRAALQELAELMRPTTPTLVGKPPTD